MISTRASTILVLTPRIYIQALTKLVLTPMIDNQLLTILILTPSQFAQQGLTYDFNNYAKIYFLQTNVKACIFFVKKKC